MDVNFWVFLGWVVGGMVIAYLTGRSSKDHGKCDYCQNENRLVKHICSKCHDKMSRDALVGRSKKW